MNEEREQELLMALHQNRQAEALVRQEVENAEALANGARSRLATLTERRREIENEIGEIRSQRESES